MENDAASEQTHEGISLSQPSKNVVPMASSSTQYKILASLGATFILYKLAHSTTGYRSIHDKLKKGSNSPPMAFPNFLTTHI